MIETSRMQRDDRSSPMRLGLWMAATVVFAHSPHVILYDVIGVPDPDNTLVSTVPVFINRSLSIMSAITFYMLARDFFDRRSLVVGILVLAALDAMLNQHLLRNFIMDGVVSHDWIYSFIENMARPLEYLATSIMIVAMCRRAKSVLLLAASGLAIAALAVVVIDPFIDGAVAKLVASVEYLDTGNIYNPPYGWQVDVPSYLTFVEPVIASYVIAALIWNRLSHRLAVRIAQFILIVMAMAGAIVPTLVYSFYQNMRLTTAIFSEGQFGLQVLVLSLMTAVGWHTSRRSGFSGV